MVPIMLLTATCTYQDVQNIRISLKLPVENFAIIRGTSFERKEIAIEVFKRKDNREIFSNELVNLIKEHENGRVIIYCAHDQVVMIFLQHYNHFCQIKI